MAKLGVAVLLAILVGAVWFAVVAMQRFAAADVPPAGVAAMWLGIVFTVVVGVGLMALVFYSSRRGYDEPPSLKK